MDKGHCLPRCCVYDYEERSRDKQSRRAGSGYWIVFFSPPPCLCRPDTQTPGALMSPIPSREWRQGPWYDSRGVLLPTGPAPDGTWLPRTVGQPARQTSHASVPESETPRIEFSHPHAPNLIANVASGILPWPAGLTGGRCFCFCFDIHLFFSFSSGTIATVALDGPSHLTFKRSASYFCTFVFIVCVYPTSTCLSGGPRFVACCVPLPDAGWALPDLSLPPGSGVRRPGGEVGDGWYGVAYHAMWDFAMPFFAPLVDVVCFDAGWCCRQCCRCYCLRSLYFGAAAAAPWLVRPEGKGPAGRWLSLYWAIS